MEEGELSWKSLGVRSIVDSDSEALHWRFGLEFHLQSVCDR